MHDHLQPPDPVEDREAMEEAHLEHMRKINPWRMSIENILTGDNYLRSGEWHDLMTDLDRLYQLADSLESKLQDAYASGRRDEKDEDDTMLGYPRCDCGAPATFVEEYIRGLPRTPAATDTEKALVAGNIRNFANVFRAELARTVEPAIRTALAYINEPAGLTPEIIADKAAFAAHMARVEQHKKQAVQLLRAAL